MSDIVYYDEQQDLMFPLPDESPETLKWADSEGRKLGFKAYKKEDYAQKEPFFIPSAEIEEAEKEGYYTGGVQRQMVNYEQSVDSGLNRNREDKMGYGGQLSNHLMQLGDGMTGGGLGAGAAKISSWLNDSDYDTELANYGRIMQTAGEATPSSKMTNAAGSIYSALKLGGLGSKLSPKKLKDLYDGSSRLGRIVSSTGKNLVENAALTEAENNFRGRSDEESKNAHLISGGITGALGAGGEAINEGIKKGASYADDWIQKFFYSDEFTALPRGLREKFLSDPRFKERTKGGPSYNRRQGDYDKAAETIDEAKEGLDEATGDLYVSNWEPALKNKSINADDPNFQALTKDVDDLRNIERVKSGEQPMPEDLQESFENFDRLKNTLDNEDKFLDEDQFNTAVHSSVKDVRNKFKNMPKGNDTGKRASGNFEAYLESVPYGRQAKFGDDAYRQGKQDANNLFDGFLGKNATKKDITGKNITEGSGETLFKALNKEGQALTNYKGAVDRLQEFKNTMAERASKGYMSKAAYERSLPKWRKAEEAISKIEFLLENIRKDKKYAKLLDEVAPENSMYMGVTSAGAMIKMFLSSARKSRNLIKSFYGWNEKKAEKYLQRNIDVLSKVDLTTDEIHSKVLNERDKKRDYLRRQASERRLKKERQAQ